jgi:tetratricopeptide (TPR) repeat protein
MPSRLPLWLLFACAIFAALSPRPVIAGIKDNWVEVRSPHFTVISNAGDKQARRMADQFEQFREVFQTAFPKLRVDLGKPLVIFALKNEDSMKLMLPGYWEVKGGVHPAGIYAPGEDVHMVAVRLDTEGDNPFEVVYHEYTHALMDLNFRGLPLWLGEGIAEFFGNSTIREKDVAIGQISAYHLRVLHQSSLIPVEALLQADHSSPYYNEQNRASVFYAESWTIVHYLLLDPEARKRQLLQNFLDAWDKSGNQVEAARQAFGDLKKFGEAMESYSRKDRFFVGQVKTSVHGDTNAFTSRSLSPAEGEAWRGAFYLHTGRPIEAKAAIDAAIQTDGNLALAHEDSGLLALRELNYESAASEFSRAIALGSSNAVVYFYNARARMRHGTPTPDAFDNVVADLEKSIQLNPQFAPAYALLATVCSTRKETYEKARSIGLKAVQLEPGNLFYAVGYSYVLLNTGKVEAAKILSTRILAAAKTPAEQSMAMQLSQSVASREEYAANLGDGQRVGAKRESSDAQTQSAAPSTQGLPTNAGQSALATSVNPNRPPRALLETKEYTLDGVIASLDCQKTTDGALAFITHTVKMTFHYSDLAKLRMTDARGLVSPVACSGWKGRQVKISFYSTPDKADVGELTGVQFF